jgi:hypothetical protein
METREIDSVLSSSLRQRDLIRRLGVPLSVNSAPQRMYLEDVIFGDVSRYLRRMMPQYGEQPVSEAIGDANGDARPARFRVDSRKKTPCQSVPHQFKVILPCLPHWASGARMQAVQQSVGALRRAVKLPCRNLCLPASAASPATATTSARCNHRDVYPAVDLAESGHCYGARTNHGKP